MGARMALHDGLGERRVARLQDGEEVEHLCIRQEIAGVPSFEFALRERVSRLASFRHPSYARVRSVERSGSVEAPLTLVSDRISGQRLSDLLAAAEAKHIPVDIGTALCLIRQLVPAIAILQESARDTSHGAIGPERLIVTPQARLVVAEYVLGSALEQLLFPRERYWVQLRVALPRVAGLARFDHLADVAQIGVAALSLVLGRCLKDDEFPARTPEIVATAAARDTDGSEEPLAPALTQWLERALQLDPRHSFPSAVEARTALDRAVDESGYDSSPAHLESFLAALDGKRRAPLPKPEPQPVRLPIPTAASPLSVAAVAAVATPAVAVTAPAVAVATVSGPREHPRSAPLEQDAHAWTESSRSVAQATEGSRPVARSGGEAAVIAPPPVVVTPAGTPSARTLTTDRAPEPTRRLVPSSFSTQTEAPELESSSEIEPPSSRRRPAVAAAAFAAALLVGSAGTFAFRQLFAAPATAPAMVGTLSVTTDPPGAQMLIDGVERGVTPAIVDLPPGDHLLVVRGAHGLREVPVSLVAGSKVSQFLDLPQPASPANADVPAPPTETAIEMAPAVVVAPASRPVTEGPVGGWIAIVGRLEVQVFEGDKLLGNSQLDRIMLAAGPHELELVNNELGYRTARKVDVVPGKVVPISFEVPKGSLALNALPWAEVTIDGEAAGETPLGNVMLPIGQHDVVFRHPELGEQRHRVAVTLKAPARLSVDLRTR